MTQWTETARRTLDEYCVRSKAVLTGTGADADEVIDDLRRHVDEEIRVAGLTVVTEGDIRRILDRVGEPGSAVEMKADAAQSSPPPATVPERGKEAAPLHIAGISFHITGTRSRAPVDHLDF